MKKFIQILSATIVGSSMLLGVASADAANCTIKNTGNNSVNTCTNDSSNDVSVVCDNNIVELNVNGQTATSGNGTGDGNTQGGTVTTGSAVNYNGTTSTLGASCGTAAAAPVNTTVAPTTPAGGKGAAAATPAATAAPAAAKVASLPETGSNTVLEASIAGVAVLGGAIAVSRFGVSAYRRFAVK